MIFRIGKVSGLTGRRGSREDIRGQFESALSKYKECFEIMAEIGVLDDNSYVLIYRNKVNWYIEIGIVYRDQGKFTQAEDLFKKAIQLNLGNDLAYTGLVEYYRKQGKFDDAEGLPVYNKEKV